MNQILLEGDKSFGGVISHDSNSNTISNTEGIPTMAPPGFIYILINESSSDINRELFALGYGYKCRNFDPDYIATYIKLGGSGFQGLAPSEEAKLRYRELGGTLTDEDLMPDNELEEGAKIVRWHLDNDPILMQVLQELGWGKFYDEGSGWGSGVGELHMYPEKYREYIKIDEYDGIESIEVDYDWQKANERESHAKQIILSDELSSAEKMEQLMILYNL